MFLWSAIAISLVSLAAGQKTCPMNGVFSQSLNKCIVDMWEDTFYGAELACVNMGGHMPSVHNMFQNNELAQIVRSRFCCTAWIGWDQSLQWTDFSPIDFRNFAPGQPTPDFRCVEIDPNNSGRWLTQNCTNKNSFVCAVDPIQKCPDGWSFFAKTNRCYKKMRPGRSSTWDEANTQCRAAAAELVSIHSREENQFVMLLSVTSLSRTEFQDQSWIGLRFNDGSNTDVSWSDRSPVDYRQFAPNEPNLVDRERCWLQISNLNFVVRDQLSFWHNHECPLRLDNFVCKLRV